MPRRKERSDYEVSNDVTEVYYSRFSHKEYRKFLNSGETAASRQERAQSLLDYLCGKFGIRGMRVYVVDKPRPVKNGDVFEAFYYLGSCSVRVFNLTGRGNPVSIRVMVVTVLHEFMHHYDRFYLGIESTPHTSGFFKRIKDLKSKLE